MSCLLTKTSVLLGFNSRRTIPSTASTSRLWRLASRSSESATDYTLRLLIPTSDDMEEIGALLSVFSSPPDVLLLDGDLGAGKTTFSRGFVGHKLGLDDQDQDESHLRITSPTYLLSNSYTYEDDELGAKEIRHMDLYRLNGTSSSDFDPLDLDHVFHECVSLIEWPGRLVPHKELMPPTTHLLDVDIKNLPRTDTRRMTLYAPSDSIWIERLKKLVDEGMLEDLIET